jgi:hypothetical protein
MFGLSNRAPVQEPTVGTMSIKLRFISPIKRGRRSNQGSQEKFMVTHPLWGFVSTALARVFPDCSWTAFQKSIFL